MKIRRFPSIGPGEELKEFNENDIAEIEDEEEEEEYSESIKEEEE